MDLSVVIGRKKLANPVGVASGTFGYGSEYEQLFDFSVIGALYTKAVTLSPRQGNDVPRIVETPCGILNSIGLANVGVERFLAEKMPYCATLPCAVIVNVAGSTKEEYASVVERCETNGAIFGYEINVSCPNVKHGGMAFGTDPHQVENLVRDLRGRTERPLIVKLTPNVTDITVTAHAAQAGGADAVSCINTLVGMAIDVEAKRPVLPMKTGGLSGPAIRPVGVAATYAVSRVVSIPVIGMGGIACGRDALEYLLAGASAVQIGTANFVDPSTASRVYAAIREFAEQEKLTCVKDFHSFIG
jgi:dihydroorotate dehydrogenase (NAD+) catalytic subunit